MSLMIVREDELKRKAVSFAPITPAKTQNCALNCAVSCCDDPPAVPDFGAAASFACDVEVNRTEAAPLPRCKLGVEGCYCFKVAAEDRVVEPEVVVPDVKNKDEEVTVPSQKSKKQKVGPAVNKKPGEKRQFKYYWPKIDVPRPRTPAPKTPKAVTPKPPRSKVPKPPKPKASKVVTPKPRRTNSKRKLTTSSKISELAEEEPVKQTTCKKTLDFEAATTTDLELGLSSTKPGCIVSNEDAINIFEKTTNDILCREGLNTCDADIGVTDVKPKIEAKEKRLIVYHRRLNNKCLNRCRNLEPNVPESFKKKRRHRKKMSFEALKQFEGFSRTCVVGDSVDRILSLKGKLRMLLPSKVDLSQDFFSCVFSLLSSRVVFTKKKRSLRSSLSRKQLVDEDEPIHGVTCFSSPILEPPKDESTEENKSIVQENLNFNVDVPALEVQLQGTEQSKTIQENLNSNVNDDIRELELQLRTEKPAKIRREAKAGVVKEKNSRRPYNLKKKQDDYLSNLKEWSDASVEEIMDKFARKFGSLKLYDDPKTWLVVVNDQESKTEDFYDEIKMKEERDNLFKKIVTFLKEMYYYQGSKEFIRWNGSVLDSVVGVFLTQNVSDILSSNAYMSLASRYPIKSTTNSDTKIDNEELKVLSSQESPNTVCNSQEVIIEHPDDDEEEIAPDSNEDEAMTEDSKKAKEQAAKEFDAALREMLAVLPDLIDSKKKGKQVEGLKSIDWEKIRVRFLQKSERTFEHQDSVDWEAVRKAKVGDIAKVIRPRGQHHIIAAKIQQTLNRILKDHGNLDLEWLRTAPPQVAKTYLLSFYGLGLKSVECLRLLTLRHHGFPVDVNIGRIAIRLGWVPIKPLPPGMSFHLLQKYPLEDEIQKYLWPRLSHYKRETLYHLHYQMITFGKVFCHKKSPNCRACPFKADCKYYASLSESQKLALPGPKDRKPKKSKKHEKIPNPFDRIIERPKALPNLRSSISSCLEICVSSSNVGSSSEPPITFDNVSQAFEYFVEVPPSPNPDVEEVERDEVDLVDIEDCCDGYMYHLNLTTETKTSSNCLPESNMSSQNPVSREMVSVPSIAANNPLPKQVNVSRLRTEHQVYELPEDNPLLVHLNLEKQLGDVPYLLAIWTSDQVKVTCANTEECPCSGEGECTCRQDSPTIPGTLLLPVQTILRRYFPLNGTYFQMNEVFADKETSKQPFDVPTNWIWNLKKRTLYCGSSTSAIVKGTTEMEIRQCFREGFVCTRGFDRKTKSPKKLPRRFHYRPKGKTQPDNEDEEE